MTTDRPDILRQLEAMLFASTAPLSVHEISAQISGDYDVAALLVHLQQEYSGRGFHLVETGGGWAFRTAPDLAEALQFVSQPRRKLPRATAEVMAIIAYHQPVTRAEIEAVRGVSTHTGTYDLLLELGWIKPGPHRDTPGRPATWVTTDEFLNHFNLTNLRDLPGLEELEAAGLLDKTSVIDQLPKDTHPEDTQAEAESA
ncbi:MAG: SMC-Scp complex subunit ScpB [Alphaproteobacteria bacterium]|nr:SMC-Scp complex subunit ScpB [Alphaproteobacteria bacterium]NDC55626.1 SMC-Scp complex subunit ScpB [Alphaproteobacteria bacterium]NDG03732.1 SMC-Scp complex subunit ScpB [Alphaproteobacteria bacterium]